MYIDQADTSEYVLAVDSSGCFVIHRLDFAGHVVSPPAFIEEKHPHQRSAVGFSPTLYFGHSQYYV
jgi:hypothetical protein